MFHHFKKLFLIFNKFLLFFFLFVFVFIVYLKKIPGWRVDTRNNQTDVTTRRAFDWLVVANGHYTIPDKKPIQSVTNIEQYPGTVMHSIE